jgi:hypothetical protein
MPRFSRAFVILLGGGLWSCAALSVAEDLDIKIPPLLAERPVTDSINATVEKMEREREAACREAEIQGLPCFPTLVDVNDPRAALERAIERLRRQKLDTHSGPPVPDPLGLPRPYAPQPTTALAGVSFDPVCTVKALLKAFKGRNNTYYLYRVHGPQGEYISMRDRPVNTSAGPGSEFEFLGKYSGECEALAAHARAERELLLRNQRERAAKSFGQALAAPSPVPDASR